MTLFGKTKSHSEKMKDAAYKASLNVIIGWIEAVARNGHFSYRIDIRKEFGQSGLSRDIVDRMKKELESQKYGYCVIVEEDRLIINW